jgi:FMN phosphatase YigB (HAD superfamily)
MKFKTKVLVLDFDNTIFLDPTTRKGSEEIKDEAWYKVFPQYDRRELEALIEEVKRSIVGGKGDRRDIALAVCRRYHLPASDADKYSAKFNEIVQEGIMKVGVSKDAREALAELSGVLPVYINTATPQQPSIESLTALGIIKFFKGIYGRPGTKAGNIKDIIEREGIQPEEITLVDDSPSSYRISQEVGCRFIGMHTARVVEWHKRKQPFPIVHSLKEVINHL